MRPSRTSYTPLGLNKPNKDRGLLAILEVLRTYTKEAALLILLCSNCVLLFFVLKGPADTEGQFTSYGEF